MPFAQEMGRVVRKGSASEAALKEVCRQVAQNSLIHSSLHSDTSCLLLVPQFIKHPPPHAIHTHHTTHTINTYTPNTIHTHIHALQKAKSSTYHLFAAITYVQILGLGEDIK